jgi:hypothetical protein
LRDALAFVEASAKKKLGCGEALRCRLGVPLGSGHAIPCDASAKVVEAAKLALRH